MQTTANMGDLPQQMKCPYCLNSTVTIVTYKNGYISYVACLLALLLFGLVPSFLLIPAIMLLTKTLIHRCPVCSEELGGDGKIFHAIGIKDTMVSFKIGEFGLILTKTVVIGLLLLITTLGVLAFRINQIPTQQWQGYHVHDMPKVIINDTWQDYLTLCAREQVFENQDAYRTCEMTYGNKTIHNWKGYSIRVEDYQGSLLKYLHHSVSILVRMDPAESEFHPDLLLTADSEVAAEMSSSIGLLDRGSEFTFSAVIQSNVRRDQYRHFHLVSIKKEDGYIEIPPHLHEHGRYGGNSSFLSG